MTASRRSARWAWTARLSKDEVGNKQVRQATATGERSGRIVAVADAFVADAFPNKQAWPVAQALSEIVASEASATGRS